MMKTVKTSELTGASLDWSVAKAIGEYKPKPAPNYSTDWSQGGPILQNHISELIDCGEYGWEACCNGTYGATGNTALEAVCKAYVASKLGNEVEIPEELL